MLLSGAGIAQATGYGLDDRGVRVPVPVRSRIFSSSRCPDRLWGPPSLLANGFRGGSISPGLKQPGRAPLATAEVYKMWICTSTPPYAFMAWCIIS
jgi:hypothetical protein